MIRPSLDPVFIVSTGITGNRVLVLRATICCICFLFFCVGPKQHTDETKRRPEPRAHGSEGYTLSYTHTVTAYSAEGNRIAMQCSA